MADKIRTGQSSARDSAAAVRELHDQLFQPSAGLVIFFCASRYDLKVIAREMDRAFAGVQVVGCTTAGEIGPLGYLDGSITGISFPSDSFTAVSGRVDHLQRFTFEQGEALVGSLQGRLETLAPWAQEKNIFAFQMMDGLSLREETVTQTFQRVLGKTPLTGGSAGDAERFAHTFVFSEGGFYEDSAVLVLAATSLPFMTFSTEHFTGTDRRAVVTAANTSTRTVLEIDALPAAEGYARLVGVDASELNPSFFSTHPVVVRIGVADHARAIRMANPDGSLTFYCAMEEGVVLRAALRGDLVTDLVGTFVHVRHNLGAPSLVLACDCLLRNQEITQLGVKERVAEIFRLNKAVGFATYGEQLRGVHVNQTLTGIAFGGAEGQ
jgi:hypothetical protein